MLPNSGDGFVLDLLAFDREDRFPSVPEEAHLRVTLGQHEREVSEGDAIVLMALHFDAFGRERLKKRLKALQMLDGGRGHLCGLTLDMSGDRRHAQHAVGRPLDGRVRRRSLHASTLREGALPSMVPKERREGRRARGYRL